MNKDWIKDVAFKNTPKKPEKPVGNTKTTGLQHQLYRWFFTLKASSIQLSQLFEVLQEISKQFVFSLEKGGTTDYEHYQGVFSLKNKEYFSTVKNHFPSVIHLESCSDWFASRAYCSKSDTHIAGPWTERSIMVKTIETLRPWQKDLETELITCDADDRKIIVYVDKEGGKGKSQFCKYMAIKHNAVVLQNGAKKDIAYCINNQKIVLFNLARDTEDRLNYDAIESIKDGMIFSSKYESNMKLFNSPHVVIFSNYDLDWKRMTKDRWDIRRL